MPNILILQPQIPFVKGGTELLVESFQKAIMEYCSSLNVEIIKIPFNWHPAPKLLDNIIAWRLLDLTQFSDKKIDLVISTKFPSYAISHPNKVLWLIHQFRQIYDLKGTIYGAEPANNSEKIIYKNIRDFDNKFITECKDIYTISDTVSERLQLYNNINSETLLPPSPISSLIKSGEYKDYFLIISRLDSLKRIELAINALKFNKTAKLKIIGTGAEKARLQKIIDENNLHERCELLGFVENDILIQTLQNARAIIYTPYLEDYGYATVEGLLAGKPIITCKDSGEVAKIVNRYKCGDVVTPNPEDIAQSMDKFQSLAVEQLLDIVQQGKSFAKKISWQNVIQKLIVKNLE